MIWGSSDFLWKINGFRMLVELRELQGNGAIRESNEWQKTF
jgi:hypothetical protein